MARAGLWLDAIVREDKSFDPKHFVTGSRSLTMIVTHCRRRPSPAQESSGREVYDGFETAIRTRSSARETVDPVSAIDNARFTGAEPAGKTAQSRSLSIRN